MQLSGIFGCDFGHLSGRNRIMEGKSRREKDDGGTAVSPLDDDAIDTDRTVSSDDEINYSVKPDFYDPNLDDRDEVWVHKRRRGVTSDAVLSCPACFNMICIDCQRHEKFVTQYRAMFVFNCKIKEIEVRHAEKVKPMNTEECSNGVVNDELLWPVCCAVCDTKLGVFDKDEVYHFFDVLPSN